MHYTKVLITLILFTFISCTTKDSDDIYNQNFDDLKAWYKEAAVSPERAHSGGFSAYVDSTHQFSQTFEMDYKEAKTRGFKSFQVTAWCLKMDDNCKVLMVASVESPEKPIVKQVTEFEKGLEVNERWINIGHLVNLPESAPAGTKIKVYLFSPNGDKAFFDDVEVSFIRE